MVFRRWDAASHEVGESCVMPKECAVLVTSLDSDGYAEVGAHPATGREHALMPVPWRGLPAEVVLPLATIRVPATIQVGDRVVISAAGIEPGVTPKLQEPTFRRVVPEIGERDCTVAPLLGFWAA